MGLPSQNGVNLPVFYSDKIRVFMAERVLADFAEGNADAADEFMLSEMIVGKEEKR